MTPEEAQQAQTIAEAKERIQWAANCRHVLTYTAKRNEFAVLKRRAKKFQRIIDSQAQKIEQQDADIANLLNKLANWPATYERQEQKIAEQAKEIERLKDLVRKISGAEPDPFNIVAGVRRSHNKQQTVKR